MYNDVIGSQDLDKTNFNLVKEHFEADHDMVHINTVPEFGDITYEIKIEELKLVD